MKPVGYLAETAFIAVKLQRLTRDVYNLGGSDFTVSGRCNFETLTSSTASTEQFKCMIKVVFYCIIATHGYMKR